jgi:hypothetical protein
MLARGVQDPAYEEELAPTGVLGDLQVHAGQCLDDRRYAAGVLVAAADALVKAGPTGPHSARRPLFVNGRLVVLRIGGGR